MGKAMTGSDPKARPVETPQDDDKGLSATFRTSVYFARPVHDKLRLIAFVERKTITDLINEGLDAVLTARGYSTTAQLRKKQKERRPPTEEAP